MQNHTHTPSIKFYATGGKKKNHLIKLFSDDKYFLKATIIACMQLQIKVNKMWYFDGSKTFVVRLPNCLKP